MQKITLTLLLTFFVSILHVNAQKCYADFSFAYDSAVKNKVNFKNKSAGSSAATFTWIFGDGTASNANSPSHTYATVGPYVVCVIMYDSATRCSDSACKQISAACVSSSTLNLKDFDLSFAVGSKGIAYRWDFGDGSTSTNTTGTHTYSKAGTYNVCLTTWCSKTDSAVTCKTIKVKPTCKAFFGVKVDSAKKYKLYLINKSSSSSTTAYQWTFGDGGSSNLRNPSHKYATFGSYEVCLTVTDTSGGSRCSSTYCDTLGLDSNGRLLKAGGFEIEVIEESAGVKNHEAGRVKIYPNPAGEKLFLEVDASSVKYSRVEILDIAGSVCLKQELDPQSEVHTVLLDGMKAGFYFVRLINAEGSLTVKLRKN